MASKTAQTEYRRKIRHKTAGRARKSALRIHGTTPVFPIHTAAADANAPAAQLSPASQAESAGS